MDEAWIRFQPDFFTRLELMAFTEHSDDLFAADAYRHLNFRTGRFDHLNFGFDTFVRDHEVFGPHAVEKCFHDP